MTFLLILLCLGGLIFLISYVKLHPFIAFLLISIAGAILFGMPLDKVAGSMEKGIGDMLSSLLILISFGAMFGKIIVDSGAAQKISTVLMNITGKKYIQWAMMVIGFIIGIPLFYGVGFVLMVPLVFSVVYKYKLPAVYIGLPMLAALSVTHGFLPPHPAPSALVVQFHANMGLTLLYGFLLAVPAIILAGPVYAQFLKKIPSEPLRSLIAEDKPESELPGSWNSFFTALLPVLLLMLTTLLPYVLPEKVLNKELMSFLGAPSIVLIISLFYATCSLGLFRAKQMAPLMDTYMLAVKDVTPILLIIAGSGALKQIFTDSGINEEIGSLLKHMDMEPLILGWIIAAVIRVCVGSATVAGLTAAGIVLPLMQSGNVNPNLMVLSIGAGSLAFSHVNDSGFWMFREYFRLSVKDTILSWSVMESIVAFVGLAGVLILNHFLS